ncbi:MAG: hypothetical protein ACKO3N_18240, partial [Verrucomicrobiota bacterium]
MKRRDFLQAAAGLAMAGGVSAATSTNAPATNSAAATSKPKYVPPVLRAPLVGSQLYGWGQYYQRAGRSLEAHLDEALSALRDA